MLLPERTPVVFTTIMRFYQISVISAIIRRILDKMLSLQQRQTLLVHFQIVQYLKTYSLN